MRLGLDCRTILNPKSGEQAGVGYYTYYLAKNLLAQDTKNHYVLFFDDHFKDFGEFEGDRVKIKTFPFYQYKKYLPVTYSQMLISAFLKREKLDLLHSPANIIPLFYNQPAVVTVHDLAIYKYPEFFPKKFLSRQAFATRVLVPQTLKKAQKIIAVSKNTKKDIIELFGVPEEKIVVIYEGIVGFNEQSNLALADLRSRFGILGRYLLFIGTIEPRKNITTLVRAFRNLLLSYESPAKDLQLIIAGAKGWNNEAIFKAISDANASIIGQKSRRSGRERRRGLDFRSVGRRQREGDRRNNQERRSSESIKYLGYISQAEKQTLLKSAMAFIFPSLYEGFGLPVLEAMNAGAPVITSKVGSLPEIAGRQAALLIDPNKEAQLTEAISQLLTDEGQREFLKIKGQERSKDFSWEKCARETLAVYHSVLK